MSCTMAGIIDSFSGEDSDTTKTQDFDQLNLCFQNKHADVQYTGNTK